MQPASCRAYVVCFTPFDTSQQAHQREVPQAVSQSSSPGPSAGAGHRHKVIKERIPIGRNVNLNVLNAIILDRYRLEAGLHAHGDAWHGAVIVFMYETAHRQWTACMSVDADRIAALRRSANHEADDTAEIISSRS